MSDQIKKEQSFDSVRDSVRDDFWDLDRLLPHRAPQSMADVPSASDSRDTEAVELTFGEDVPDDKSTLLQIPPMAGAAGRRAGDTLSARAHTPGDVRPQMSVPVRTYTPESSFIRSVSIFRWPSRYHYYERFTADAERYYNRAAEECPFVNFFAYMPQYSQMSQEQMRWYLFWRDNVRHGVYLTADYSYIFLYVYEIINLPEKIKPEDGLAQLCGLWTAYRDKFPRLDRYLGEWVCDYCLVYGLPAPIAQLSEILPFCIDKLSFKEFFMRFDAADCPFTPSLCDLLSNYNWRQSKYVTPDTKPLFEEHLYAAVLGSLRKTWLSRGNTDLSELLGLSEVKQTRNAFSGALCTYNCKRRIDVSYLSLSRSYQLRFILTDLYKLAENCIRAHLGIKSRLSASGIPEPLKEMVRSYFAEHLPPPVKSARRQTKSAEKEKSAAPQSAYNALYEPVSAVLSPEAALELEKTSWANTELLVAEADGELSDASASAGTEEPAPAAAVPAEPVTAEEADNTEETDDIPESDDPYENFVNHLNPTYYDALKHLICREESEFRALCAAAMLLPDAMIEAINEIAVTYTDDTALDADGTFWKLSDFYANDIMNAVIAREEA